MTIDAQELPVAAIGGIVVVVVVLVMNRELAEILAAELALTPCTDPGKDFQGLRPVALFSFPPGLNVSGNSVSSAGIRLFFFGGPIRELQCSMARVRYPSS